MRRAAANATGWVERNASSTTGSPRISRSSDHGPVEDQRVDLVGALVEREPVGRVVGAADVTHDADVAAHAERPLRPSPGSSSTQRAQPLRRPARLGAPLARERVEVGLRRRRAADEEHDRRLAVDPVLGPAEPAVEPADQLADVVDTRAGDGVDRVHVAPRAHEQPLRDVEVLDQPERRIPVEVAPAADHHRRDPDQVVVGPKRAVAPERARRSAPRSSGTMARARRSAAATARASRRRPAPGTGGSAFSGDHRQRVVELDRLADAAAEVDVVGVAVVGRIERHDRAERGRPSIAACSVANPAYELPNMPTAPVHHGCSASQAMTAHMSSASTAGTRRPPRPPTIRSRACRPGRPRIALVPQAAVVLRPHRDVVLAIRIGLEQGRPRARGLGQVEGRGEPHAVAHRDEDVRLRHPAQSSRIRACSVGPLSTGRRAAEAGHSQGSPAAFTRWKERLWSRRAPAGRRT